MSKRIRFLSAMLSLMVVAGSLIIPSAAIQFSEGETLGTGTISTAENRNLTDDGAVTYAKAVYKDSGNRQQAVYALEFNPTSSDYMPYVYSKYTGTGANAYISALQAESQFGMNVVAGINASFYSTATGSTYQGYWVHDGRLAQASPGVDGDIITFDSDGSINIVPSRLDYKVYLNGSEISLGSSGAIAHINKKSIADNVDNRFYYWDTECGTKTDSVIDGLEILCQKKDFSELSIGGSLKGEVLEIRTDSHYSPVGEDEFVLYVKNESPLKASVEGAVKVGDIFEIVVNEAIEESRQYTEKANTALAAAYQIVENGDNVTATNGLGEDFNTARAQRSSIGIKDDGSVVLIGAAGRNITDSSPGLTVYELADVMIQLGCKTAYNLDGGGSTQMITKVDGEFEKTLPSPDGTNGRNVANCIFIVERKTADDEIKTALNALIADNEDNTTDPVVNAIADANAVIANENSMPGDYARVYMNLKKALSGKGELDNVIASVAGISYKDYGPQILNMLWDAYDEAMAIRADENAGIEEIDNITRILRSLLDSKGTVEYNVSVGKSYEKDGGPHTGDKANENYFDTDDKELTNGAVSSSNTPTGSEWVGFHKSSSAGEEDGGRYFDVIIDLGSVQNNLTKFIAYSEHQWAFGIEAPSKVSISISDDNVNFNEVGLADPDVTDLIRSEEDETDPNKKNISDVNYTLQLDEGVSGRYVKFHLVGCKHKVFLFITELEVYMSDTPLEQAIFVTDFNIKILDSFSVIFTPDYAEELTGDNANLNWALAIAAEWNEEKQAYAVVQRAHGSNGNIIKTVPENGFVLGVHGDTGDGGDNKAYANTADVGDILVLKGIDIASKDVRPGGHITIMSGSVESTIKKNAPIFIEEKYLGGLAEEKTVAELAAMFDGSISVKDADGKAVTGNDIVGTGFTVNTGTEQYTVVVLGDINGDGLVKTQDYMFVKRNLVSSYELNDYELKAACISGGDNPKVQDYIKIKRHILDTYNLYD